MLTLSESYYQTRVNTLSEFISNITDTFRDLLPTNKSNKTGIFRELLANTTTDFSRFDIIIKQY